MKLTHAIEQQHIYPTNAIKRLTIFPKSATNATVAKKLITHESV